MIHVKYPGKLYIMGEYSVMEENHRAVLCAVNRYLSVSVKKSDTLYIESEHGTLVQGEHNLPHVKAALDVAQLYLEYKGISFSNFEMRIESQLDDGMHKKYGFGSSGVVIVAVLDGILKYHNVDISPLTLFKLSVLTQVNMNEVSSGGDLACSIFGGMISYRRYKSLPTSILDVEKDWENLEINALTKSFDVLVGYTQKGFNSGSFLNKVKAYKEHNKYEYEALVTEAESLVQSFIENPTRISCINDYRNWMVKFSEQVGIEVETAILNQLITSAKSLGFEAKVSGAGGGDCGIAVSINKDNTQLIKVWRELGIEVLEGVV